MKTSKILLAVLMLLFAIPSLATSTSISGSLFSGFDSMGFTVFNDLDGSFWLSSAPTGPLFLGFSTVGVPTVIDFGARAWQGPGFAEAGGPWGSTTNLGGGIGVTGSFTFQSTTPGPVSVTIPVTLFASLQAFQEDSDVLLANLDFTSHGRATLQGESDGHSIQWTFAEVVFPTAVVPEPSTLLLAGSGLFTILASRRRAQKKN
jgi:PEP-CTERM motif